MHDIITIGSATEDVFLRSSAWEVREDADSPTGLDQCLPLGGKIPIDELQITTGGGATNAAVTFARLGQLRTACVCRIGATDTSGRAIVAALREARIATPFVQSDAKLRTGFSLILLSGSGERTILTHRGASHAIAPARIPWPRLRAHWFYITSLAGNRTLLRRILSHAERIGAQVAWNPGNDELAWGWDTLAPLVRRCAVINMNREEALVATRCAADDLTGMLTTLHAHAPHAMRIALLTDGKQGAYAFDGARTWHIPSRNIPAINTTGAGDAFGSAFVLGRIHGWDIPDALRLGLANAEGVITHMGAKVGILRKLPSRHALQRYEVAAYA
ncbi:carbohydrate kinase family protein [Candidatus Uhrbacteria bacterium]|nr:carbohydrate kinase family protein [Candidatus Uhrbacteria bacterium]